MNTCEKIKLLCDTIDRYYDHPDCDCDGFHNSIRSQIKFPIYIYIRVHL